MSLKIQQTCAKCGRTRDLRPNRGVMTMNDDLEDQRQNAGWRVINDKDICNLCIGDFLNSAVN